MLKKNVLRLSCKVQSSGPKGRMMATQSRKVRVIAVILTLLLAGAAYAADTPKYVVISPVASMYSGPSQDTDVVSQALFGSNVGLVEEQPNWVKIRTLEDDYVGWVPQAALLPLNGKPPYASSGNLVEVNNLRAHVYREPDVTAHEPMLTLPFETRLEVASMKGNGERWIQVRLPDSRLGWIQHGDVTLLSAPVPVPATRLTIDEMVAFGRRFLGLPYTWGGRSSFGYDCSGFAQMLVRRRGYLMPRDADIQAAWTGLVSVEKVADLRAGDLLYFGSKGNITHTGVFIGNGEFIHATTHNQPVIQISPLDDYWTKLLVAQRRVKQ
jgi:cell wall-associated NlpC family hydrolase